MKPMKDKPKFPPKYNAGPESSQMSASMVPSADNSIQPQRRPENQPPQTPDSADFKPDADTQAGPQLGSDSGPDSDTQTIPSVIPVTPAEIAQADQTDPELEFPSVIPVDGSKPTSKRTFLQKVAGVLRFIRSACHWTFGFATLFVGLAVLATIPMLNLFSLGYLLEVSGRIAKTGRVRVGFVGVRKAAAVGGIVLMTVLWTLPLFFVAEMRTASRIIDPYSTSTTLLYILLIALSGLIIGHLIWAYIRGGKIRHFLWLAPVRFFKWIFTPNKYTNMRDDLWNFTLSLRLPYYFWLGARGFAGAVAWLIVPVAILVAAAYLPPGPGLLLAFPAMLLLATVVLYLPFLQTHFAMQNRMGAMFEVGAVRRQFTRAPIAFWFSLMIALLLALPLYLLKIELTPREVAWLPSVVFVAFILPARFLIGWAVGRAHKQSQARHFMFRWMSRLAIVPVVLYYVFIIYFTQYVSWYGAYSVLDQHAFLVPAPLFGL